VVSPRDRSTLVWLSLRGLGVRRDAEVSCDGPGMELQFPLVVVAPRNAAALFGRFLSHLDGCVDTHARDLLLGSECFAPGEWTIACEVDALAGFAGRLSSGKVHLAGHSGAAAVVLAFAAAWPGRVASIAVSEPPWVGADPWSEIDVAFREELQRVADLPDADLPAGFIQLFTAGPAGRGEFRPMDQLALAAVRAVAPEYLRATLQRDRFQTMPAPVLVAHGSKSPRRMALTSEILAASFRDARVVQIDGAGHFDLWAIGARTLAASWRDLTAPDRARPGRS
jgi:pimeloyl-ACP methyl ester carboxylesterase